MQLVARAPEIRFRLLAIGDVEAKTVADRISVFQAAKRTSILHPFDFARSRSNAIFLGERARSLQSLRKPLLELGAIALVDFRKQSFREMLGFSGIDASQLFHSLADVEGRRATVRMVEDAVENAGNAIGNFCQLLLALPGRWRSLCEGRGLLAEKSFFFFQPIGKTGRSGVGGSGRSQQKLPLAIVEQFPSDFVCL